MYAHKEKTLKQFSIHTNDILERLSVDTFSCNAIQI